MFSILKNNFNFLHQHRFYKALICSKLHFWNTEIKDYIKTKQMNQSFKNLILHHDHQPLIHYDQLGKEAMLAIPTPEHYLPLLYTLGLQGKDESVAFFNDKPVGGSLTMTSVKIG